MNIDYIKCGDNVALMKTLPDNSIDLTVTSPPYDNLRTYDGFAWDVESVAKELFRITKEGGIVVWIVNDGTVNKSETGTSFKQALLFMNCGFKLHDTMIWYKDSFSFPDRTRYRQCFEYMFVFVKGNIKTFNPIGDRKNKWVGTTVHGTSRNIDGSIFRKSNDKKTNVAEFGVRFNVWEQPTEKSNKSGHPAPFPEKLASDHIISWSNEGDLVFDPFVGSGTTCKMAMLNNRHYIGFDISQKYCEIAETRIADAYYNRNN